MKKPPSDAVLARAFVVLSSACHRVIQGDPAVKAKLLEAITTQHLGAEAWAILSDRALSDDFLDAICVVRDIITDPDVAAVTPKPGDDSKIGGGT